MDDEINSGIGGYIFISHSHKDIKKVREILETDPLCFREYKSTKGLERGNISFDDKTYWRGIAL